MLLFACAVALFIPTCSSEYLIGTGIGDITGPAAETNMMGYANPVQVTGGIHIRLYSRAFIIGDKTGKNRVAFVNVDAGMISEIVRAKVISEVKAKFDGLYDEKNVVLSATHTHSGPGGFHQYLLYDITSLGFVKRSFDAYVQGIVKSIADAHQTLRPGKIFINEGELLQSNINRSPTSYLKNPSQERAKYKHDTDTNMTVLKFLDSNNHDAGLISWFAVHGTSMNNTNKLISGDNKGYASQMFERMMNAQHLVGKGPFVGAFAQSNEGDVSPNLAGPKCIDTGLPCDILSSTCGGRVKKCIAFGPGRDMFESTRIIGMNQFKKGYELYQAAKEELNGPVGSIQQFVNMSNQIVTLSNGTKVQTCKPAMGFSFAAGTTDGPGAFDFTQGMVHGNPFWNIVRNFISKPSPAQAACHHPKPILLNTGEMHFPYQWQPTIVSSQLLRIGQLVIVAAPGEFTTMSGRRLREAVLQTLLQAGFPKNTKVVIAGLSNLYTDYIATYEEYQAQRYEAASTIYGPHTLDAHIQQFKMLAKNLAENKTVAKGPTPPYFVDKVLSFLPGVIYDHPGLEKKFGQVLIEPKPSYKGGESVVVRFVSGNPRNDMRLEGTYLTVERYNVTTKAWVVDYTDAYWETKFRWFRTGFLSELEGTSEADITWDIPIGYLSGTYRIRHLGNAKHMLKRDVIAFEGLTRTFKVI